MKGSAFDPDGDHDACMKSGSCENGHAMVTSMTKHAKSPHGRGFHGKGGTAKAPQGGGGGMASNSSAKGTGTKKEPMQSHGEY